MTQYKREACGEWEREEQENWWAGGASLGKGGDCNGVGHHHRQTELGKGPGGGISLGESQGWYQGSSQSREWLETEVQERAHRS